MRNYHEYKSIVEENLLDYIPAPCAQNAKLMESMRYSLTAGGKRVRPVLLLAACEAAGGDINDAIPFACAIEYIHTYSLIHDDLPAMDNDDLRRGKPTNHKVYGEAMAILAGDGLLSLAFDVMTRELEGLEGEEMQNKLKALRAISTAAGCTGMISGQAADIEAEGKKCSEEELKYIHKNKTGALILSAIVAGLTLVGADSQTVADFVKYGMNLGLAFQIHDDILDATASTEELGKPAGSDQGLNKSTYVSLYGLEGAREKLEEATSKAINSIKDYESAEFFVNLINELKDRRN